MKKLIALTIVLAAVAGVPVAYAQDAKAGEKKAAMCVGCHGIPYYQASFPEVHKVPMISGQNTKYIATALAAYKKGERKHPTMRAIAASLSDQDMADLGAFYAAQAGTPEPTKHEAPGEVARLLERGGCAACHGADYNKALDPSYPKIAGQHADYLFVAMKAYRIEGNPQVGRGNAIMGGMVRQFSNNELKAIAKHVAKLPGDLRTVEDPRFR